MDDPAENAKLDRRDSMAPVVVRFRDHLAVSRPRFSFHCPECNPSSDCSRCCKARKNAKPPQAGPERHRTEIRGEISPCEARPGGSEKSVRCEIRGEIQRALFFFLPGSAKRGCAKCRVQKPMWSRERGNVEQGMGQCGAQRDPCGAQQDPCGAQQDECGRFQGQWKCFAG